MEAVIVVVDNAPDQVSYHDGECSLFGISFHLIVFKICDDLTTPLLSLNSAIILSVGISGSLST